MNPGAYRCSTCGISWPYTRDYRRCPQCQDACARIDDVPLDEAEAESLRKTADFERYWTRWDRQRLEAESKVIAALPEIAEPRR